MRLVYGLLFAIGCSTMQPGPVTNVPVDIPKETLEEKVEEKPSPTVTYFNGCKSTSYPLGYTELIHKECSGNTKSWRLVTSDDWIFVDYDEDGIILDGTDTDGIIDHIFEPPNRIWKGNPFSDVFVTSIFEGALREYQEEYE